MEERMRILEMVEAGVITAEQGVQLLAALETPPLTPSEDPQEPASPADPQGTDLASESEAHLPKAASPPMREAHAQTPLHASALPGDEPQTPRPAEPPPDLAKWRSWWIYPLAGGTGITVLSGLLIFQGNQAAWHWFWMFSIGALLFLGILITTLAWVSRSARWLHVRVHTGQEEWPRRIAISFPLPIRLTATLLRRFGHLIPAIQNTALDELVLALGESATPESPLYVEVDEGAGHERVQVYIG